MVYTIGSLKRNTASTLSPSVLATDSDGIAINTTAFYFKEVTEQVDE